MTKQLQVNRDPTSAPLYMTAITDAGYSATLAADTDTTVAVPADAAWAIVSASDHFWGSDAAITLPVAGGGFSATNFEHNKDQIDVRAVTTLHFRARNVTDISVSFWR